MKDESATAKHSKLSIEDNKPFLPNAFEFDKLADPATIKVESEEHRPRKSCPTVSLIKLIKTCSKQLLGSKELPNEHLLAKLTGGMQEIRHRRLALKLVLSSGIGLTVQKVYEHTSERAGLEGMAKVAKEVIRGIKLSAYRELFEHEVEAKALIVEGNDNEPIRLNVKKSVMKHKGTIRRKEKEELKESLSKTKRLPSVIIVGEATDICATQEKDIAKDNEVPSRDTDLAKSIREKLYKELRKAGNIATENARKLAEDIELAHRKADMTMGKKYQQNIVNYIKMLQRFSKAIA
eukprot:TRINITY_DN2604_c0_g2_i5.p1 TRINITY_DN2604_c0_g2~~TRINITY_DN2604_c0_g2_i5.p1  ORF type:complete len:293 (-),score=86.71 TRINITY_DN2604_c0_g2_i5:81-959(-)